MTVLSIGMIVKNEAQNLRRTLEALQPLLKAVKGQLIIADTGSEDETIAIAKEFTKEVFSIRWENDFAKARNATLMRARGEWFFYLDADEVLANPHELIRFFRSTDKNKYGSISITIKNCLSEKQDLWSSFNSPRLFRRSPSTRFVDALHEHVPTLHPIYYLNETHLLHYGYNNDDRAFLSKKADRNLDILEKMIGAERFQEGYSRAKLLLDYADSLKMTSTAENRSKAEEALQESIQVLWSLPEAVDGEKHRCSLLARAYGTLMSTFQINEEFDKLYAYGKEYLNRRPKLGYWDLDIFYLLINAAHKLGLEDDEIAEYRQSYLEAAKQKDAEVTRYMVISSEDMIDQIKAAQGIYYHEQKDNDKAWETIKDADMAAVKREMLAFQWQLALDNDIEHRLPYLYPHLPEEYKEDILQAIADVIDGTTDTKRQSIQQGLLQIQEDKAVWSLLALCAENEAEMQGWLTETTIEDLPVKRGGQLLWRCIERELPIHFLAHNIGAYGTNCAEAHHNLPYKVYVYYSNSEMNTLSQLELKAAQYLLCHCTFMMKVDDDILSALWSMALSYGLTYMKMLYREDILQSVAEILSPLERFLLYCQQALDEKTQGNYDNALTRLKEGVALYPYGQRIVRQLTEEIEELADPIGAELKQLAATVKKQINELIEAEQLSEAEGLINELSAIIPDDPDIPYLLEQIQPADIIWN